MLPFGRVASLSIFPCLKNSLDYWIPHHQSDSWQPPHGVCLIMGDEDNRTVSGFVLHPLGRPGLPYFQSSYPWVWERSCILPSPPPFPPWHIFFPHHMPRRHVPSIVPSLRSIGEIITVVDSGLFSHWPPHQVHSAPFDALPLPLSSVCPGNLANHCSSLKNSNRCWRRCHHKVATLMDLHYFVLLTCHAREIFLRGEGARANGGGVVMVVLCSLLLLVFATKYWFLCSRTRIVVFFWWQPWLRSCGRPQGCQLGPWQLRCHQCLITICCFWVVGAGFADRNAPALGTRQDSWSAGAGGWLMPIRLK